MRVGFGFGPRDPPNRAQDAPKTEKKGAKQLHISDSLPDPLGTLLGGPIWDYLGGDLGPFGPILGLVGGNFGVAVGTLSDQFRI